MLRPVAFKILMLSQLSPSETCYHITSAHKTTFTRKARETESGTGIAFRRSLRMTVSEALEMEDLRPSMALLQSLHAG